MVNTPSELGVVLLAAGASTRCAPLDKLQADVMRIPMLRHVAQTYLQAQVGDVHVVVGGVFAQERREILAGLPVQIHDFSDASRGMGASLSFGVQAAQPFYYKALMVGLTDMPYLIAAQIQLLAKAHEQGGITVPTYQDKPGHPVIFSQPFFAELGKLDGDAGARNVIGSHREAVRFVTFDSPEIHQDCDDLPALRALERFAFHQKPDNDEAS